jgi:hypothetical protein
VQRGTFPAENPRGYAQGKAYGRLRLLPRRFARHGPLTLFHGRKNSALSSGALGFITRCSSTGTVEWVSTRSATLPITQAISPRPWVAMLIRSMPLASA